MAKSPVYRGVRIVFCIPWCLSREMDKSSVHRGVLVMEWSNLLILWCLSREMAKSFVYHGV